MDSRELSEWIVYDGRIKVSDADIQAARICYTLACCHADPKKRRPQFKDFLPQRRSRLEMSGDEILGAFRAAFAAKGNPS